jgi:hypothetical protein
VRVSTLIVALSCVVLAASGASAQASTQTTPADDCCTRPMYTTMPVYYEFGQPGCYCSLNGGAACGYLMCQSTDHGPCDVWLYYCRAGCCGPKPAFNPADPSETRRLFRSLGAGRVSLAGLIPGQRHNQFVIDRSATFGDDYVHYVANCDNSSAWLSWVETARFWVSQRLGHTESRPLPTRGT